MAGEYVIMHSYLKLLPTPNSATTWQGHRAGAIGKITHRPSKPG